MTSSSKEELSQILSDYNKQFENINKKEEIIKPKKYVDKEVTLEIDFDDLKDDIPEKLYENYILSINQIKSYKDAKVLFDSLCYAYDINEFLNNVLLNANDDVKEYIIRYLSEIEKEEQINENECENIILFNGFLNNKNIIKDDLKRHGISEDYYIDIKKGVLMILENGAIGKRENIKKVPKVLKLRINDIRIAFKRLDSNVYIILGIYVKKESKGNNIIESIIRRNKELIDEEENIINGINNAILRQKIIEANNLYYDELIKILDSKVKIKQ